MTIIVTFKNQQIFDTCIYIYICMIHKIFVRYGGGCPRPPHTHDEGNKVIFKKNVENFTTVYLTIFNSFISRLKKNLH
jgi:hypothetical protein